MDNYLHTTVSAEHRPDPLTTRRGGLPVIPPRPGSGAKRSTGLASTSNVVTPRPLICATYLMNDIPRGTSRITLINYLLRSPRRQNQALLSSQPHVICGVTMADSQLDDELTVARIEFSDTPMWLQDLNDDPDGFPKKTALGTLWRGVDISTGEPDDSGQTELIRATRRGDLLYTEMLAEFADTNVNIQDNTGRTALHWACAGGHALLVQLCLSVTASDVGLRDEDGLTAFDIALAHDRSETIPNLFYRNMIELDEIDPQAALLRVLTVTADPASTVDRPIFPGQAIFDPVRDQNLLLVSALVNRGVDLKARDPEGNTALHLAVAGGNAEIAVRLLEGGSEVNAVDANGATPLHHAARTGIGMVEVLLDWNADTAAKDNNKMSVWDWAINSGQLDAARVIKDHGLTVHERLQDVGERKAGRGSRSLREACTLGHIAAVRQHLMDGAQVNEQGEYRKSVLHLAAQVGNLEILQLLLAAGANIHAIDYMQDTVLHTAASDGYTRIVHAMLGAGADIHAGNSSKQTPLHKAADGGHTEIVQTLISAGASTHVADNTGSTPFHKAARGGHTETVQSLLAAGAYLHAVNDNRLTALHYATSGGHTETFQALLAAGADLHAVNYNGLTALHYAASGGHTETFQALLAAGADLHAVDNGGSTALHNAASGGHTGTVQALLAAGADIHAVNEVKRTPLHLAARDGHAGTVEALLAAGAHLHAVDKYISTALHFAAACGYTETVRALLAAGAHLHAVDDHGMTPLDCVAHLGYTDTIRALLDSGADIDRKGSGETALQPAKKYHHSETVDILLDVGTPRETRSFRDVLRDQLRRWN